MAKNTKSKKRKVQNKETKKSKEIMPPVTVNQNGKKTLTLYKSSFTSKGLSSSNKLQTESSLSFKMSGMDLSQI